MQTNAVKDSKKYCEDQVIVVRTLIGMLHMSISKYFQKDARNAAPSHINVLEQVTS